MRTRQRATVVGALLSAVAALGLFTRFSINIKLSRDESIYTYGGQLFAHGVPPYVSIFDPKTPIATLLAGAGAIAARVVGRNDLYAVRGVFLVVSVLTVVAAYLVVLRLFGSVLGGLTAALVVAASWPFAVDALAGPDAKTPGVLFEVLCLWCVAGRRWFWATLSGSLAAMVWQPMIVFPLVTLVLAVSTADGGRGRAALRAIAGGALPVIVLGVYFAAAGALGAFVETAVVFPLTGAARAPETVGERLSRIVSVVDDSYGAHGLLFWAGSVLLLAVVAARLVVERSSWRTGVGVPLLAVLLTLVGEVAYACFDFQGFPDLYALVPYPAIGLGGVVALLGSRLRPRAVRLVAGVVTSVALLVAAALTWSSYTNDPTNVDGLSAQRAQGCALQRARVPGTPMLSLGSPVPLVMTHSRNPDRFVYLGSGVDRWKIAHTTGGLAGWQRAIDAERPSVVVIRGWSGPVRAAMELHLKDHGYRVGHIGNWRVFLTPDAHARAVAHGVQPTRRPSRHVRAEGGGRVRPTGCQ